jgi:predicted 2-oxoglutarate/Fe(II)-dependent dioxygenase YbiX
MFFINDDYDGGEVLFKNRLGNMPYKPKANSMLIFPATDEYQYKVLPVKSGTKYCAITFAD